MVEVQFVCPEGSYYDPVNKLCSSHYICICERSTSRDEELNGEGYELFLKLSALLNGTTGWSNIRVWPFSGMIQKNTSLSANTDGNENNTTNNIPIDLFKIEDQHNAQPNQYNLATNDVTDIASASTILRYCDEEVVFTCQESGRFRHPNDTSCKSYIYCYKWSSGLVKQYEYTCSVGLFNPDTQSCDISYVCPCRDSTTVETSTSIATDISTLPLSTAKYCFTKGIFTCVETGRFPNPNDTNCKSYIYCYVWSNGKVGQYEYTCSVGLFNPYTGSCDISYICPCIDSTAVATSMNITTEISTISLTTAKYCSSGEMFTCVENGRYPNPNDTSCKSYIYCYIWSDGRVGQYGYICSVGLFNPYTQSCDLSYICPCGDSTTIEPSTSTTTEISSSTLSTEKYCSGKYNFTCVESGRFSNPTDISCRSYVYCYKWSNGTIVDYKYTCSIGLFNPETHSCDPSYICPCTENTLPQTSLKPSDNTVTTTITSTTTNFCSVEEHFKCTENGRYPNPNDTSCKSYIYCYIWSDGRVGQYGYICSVGLFNPYTQSCDLSYICPCGYSTTIEPSTSTTTEIFSSTLSTEQYCSGKYNFTCVESGRFSNPADISCRSYVYCYKWSNGTTVDYEYTCSIGLFNPDTQSCDPSYECPCTKVTLPQTSLNPSSNTVITTITSITTNVCSDEEHFTCIENGRYPNPNDTSCKSYFYCYLWSDGSMRQYSYTCSVGVFNPNTQSCDLHYVCPCTPS